MLSNVSKVLIVNASFTAVNNGGIGRGTKEKNRRKFRFHLQNPSDYLTFLVWLQIPYQSNSFLKIISKFRSTTSPDEWKSRHLSKLIITSYHKTNDSKFIYCIITTLYKHVYGSNFPFKTKIDVTKVRFSHVL